MPKVDPLSFSGRHPNEDHRDGTAGAVPFLADGDVVSGEEWRDIIRGFEGNFFQYALWFN